MTGRADKVSGTDFGYIGGKQPCSVPDTFSAQALLSVGPSDTVTVATDNVADLSRFIDAQLWEMITG
jgi:hypothetical protein